MNKGNLKVIQVRGAKRNKEAKEKKRLKKNKESLKDVWATIKRTNETL